MPIHEKSVYKTIAEKLLKTIEKSAVGEKLPSERELMKTYHAQRTTVRRALDILAQSGRIEKIPGVGSVISDGTMPSKEKPAKKITVVKSESAGIPVKAPLEKYLPAAADTLFDSLTSHGHSRVAIVAKDADCFAAIVYGALKYGVYDASLALQITAVSDSEYAFKKLYASTKDKMTVVVTGSADEAARVAHMAQMLKLSVSVVALKTEEGGEIGGTYFDEAAAKSALSNLLQKEKASLDALRIAVSPVFFVGKYFADAPKNTSSAGGRMSDFLL